MLDNVRYVLAFILIAAVPAAFSVWLLIHPFIRHWRSLGPVRSFAVVGPAVLLVALGVGWFVDRMLAVDYGTRPVLWIPALLLYAIAAGIEVLCRRHLKLRILVGLPEMEADGRGGTLLSGGIYGRIRHPRYVSFLLGMTAAALVANYLATYLLLPVFVGLIVLIVHLEERELRQRFGEEYTRYCERVPRFLPWRKRRTVL